MLKITYRSAYLVTFLGLTLAGTACTSGPSGPAKLTICKASDSPVNMDPAEGVRKIEVKPGDNGLVVPTGEFKFASSDFYYRDFDRDFILHLTVKANEKGEPGEVEISCIGGSGLGRDTSGVSGSVEIVSDMKIISPTKILVTTKVISFELGNGARHERQKLILPGDLTGAESKLSDIYQGTAPDVEQALYQTGETTLESRTKLEEVPEEKGKKAGVQKWVRVSYSYVDPNAPKDTSVPDPAKK